MTKAKTCDQLIGDILKNRLAQFNPDFDDVDVCIGIIEDYDSDRVASITKECTDEDGVLDEDQRLELLQDAARELFYDNVGDSVLAIDKITTYTVVLSTGGPHDEFQIDYNTEGDVVGGRYVYKDWYDGATRKLSVEEAEQLAQVFGIYHE